MNLYIVKFTYHDVDTGSDIYDSWTLACDGDEAVEKTMKLNIEQLENVGYKFVDYSFKKVSFTDNGYRVIVGKW